MKTIKSNSATNQLCQFILIQPHSVAIQKLNYAGKTLIRFQRFQLFLKIVNAAYDRHYQPYFDLLNLKTEDRKTMRKQYLAQFIVNTIIETEEYDIEGIARYSNTLLDIIYDIKNGILIDPSYSTMEKILEIFFSVKRELCDEIFQQITATRL